jgi:hypothetical protein
LKTEEKQKHSINQKKEFTFCSEMDDGKSTIAVGKRRKSFNDSSELGN